MSNVIVILVPLVYVKNLLHYVLIIKTKTFLLNIAFYNFFFTHDLRYKICKLNINIFILLPKDIFCIEPACFYCTVGTNLDVFIGKLKFYFIAWSPNFKILIV